jgi:uncharacterized protein Smg (DUF494 family)
MKNRLLDAVIFLVESSMKNRTEPPDHHAIKSAMIEKGYPLDVVDRALEWAIKRLPEIGNGAIRVFSTYERAQMTTDGCGLLMRLRNLELLTDEHIELIMARAMLLEELPVDAESVRNMATVLLFDLKNSRDGFSMYIDSETGDIEN